MPKITKAQQAREIFEKIIAEDFEKEIEQFEKALQEALQNHRNYFTIKPPSAELTNLIRIAEYKMTLGYQDDYCTISF
jgi:hypothetical protein